MPTLGFTDNDGIDVGNKYLTKDYAITNYPGLFTNIAAGGLWTWGGASFAPVVVGNRSSPYFTGNVSQGVTTNIGWRQISFNNNPIMAGIKADNTLWTWGTGASSFMLGQGTVATASLPATTIGAGTNWQSVSAGGAFMAAIKTDGTLWTWGSNQFGTLGTLSATNVSRSSPNTVDTAQTWSQVSCATSSISAIKTDGSLWVWGRNHDGSSGGILGDGTTITRSSPVTIAGGGTNWKQVSTSLNLAGGAAVKTDGTLWTWGSNQAGRLGDASFTVGSLTYRSSPSTVSGAGTTWKQVVCGDISGSNIWAIKTDGTLWGWGNNTTGQIGDGTTTNRSSPVTVAGGGTSWKTVSVGAAIKTDGTLWTWGGGGSGVLGHGLTTNRSSPGTTLLNSYYWKFIASVGANLTVYGIIESDDW